MKPALQITFAALFITCLCTAPSHARNPFTFGKSQSSSTTNQSGQKLEMIMAISEGYMAIIDGNSYKVGDKIKAGTISDISFNFLEVTKSGTTKRFYINE